MLGLDEGAGLGEVDGLCVGDGVGESEGAVVGVDVPHTFPMQSPVSQSLLRAQVLPSMQGGQ